MVKSFPIPVLVDINGPAAMRTKILLLDYIKLSRNLYISLKHWSMLLLLLLLPTHADPIYLFRLIPHPFIGYAITLGSFQK